MAQVRTRCGFMKLHAVPRVVGESTSQVYINRLTSQSDPKCHFLERPPPMSRNIGAHPSEHPETTTRSSGFAEAEEAVGLGPDRGAVEKMGNIN